MGRRAARGEVAIPGVATRLVGLAYVSKSPRALIADIQDKLPSAFILIHKRTSSVIWTSVETCGHVYKVVYEQLGPICWYF
jgi:hypothetical protein